jgi:hypothetical protein
MAKLSPLETRKLERLFEMEGGHALNFTHLTLAEFVEHHTGRNLNDKRYLVRGSGSKAWLLRNFWRVEPDHLVAKLLGALIEYRAQILAEQEGNAWGPLNRLPDEDRVTAECHCIVARLAQGGAVHELDALQAVAAEPDFETVAREVRDAINRNAPDAGLDRLHTFVVKLVRSFCEARGISVTRYKPLHGLFGEYVKTLRTAGHIESEMTERILKSSISLLEAFNSVRNEQSLAHDNRLLNYEESLLIFNSVAGTVRFLTRLEARQKEGASMPERAEPDDDMPF